MSSLNGTCLVARAVPCKVSSADADCLTGKLSSLTVTGEVDKQPKKNGRLVDGISPADFVTLQSLRSSALARKTNTTSKNCRGGVALFSDLINHKGINKDIEVIAEKKAESNQVQEQEVKETVENGYTEKATTTKNETPNSENNENLTKNTDKNKNDLLSRGPVRNARAPLTHHPYMDKTAYGVAPRSEIEGYSAYGGYGSGYECGNSWTDSPEMVGCLSNSSTPDTVQSDLGYQSSSPQLRHSPSVDNSMTTAELNRLLNATELPDALSDFILKYSRRYSGSNSTANSKTVGDSNGRSRKSSGSESVDGSPKHRPMSTDSGCDSPLSAGSAPQISPAAPKGTSSGPTTPDDQFQSQTGSHFRPVISRKHDGTPRTAKDRLRSLISDSEMSEAWAWTCKCVQYFPGALCYQDPDRDSLLHIVTLHMDLAKIYALVEQMLKTDFPPSQKPFDMPNRFHETPLFLAVEKRCVEVVAYLLEAGAYPNSQTQRAERDAPLHYAAARGMTEIVRTLCANPLTDVNMQNGMGLTPLLCATKNHGVIEEESQSFIDNKATIAALLKDGADPLISDATNGKTVIHYAVDRMSTDLIEIFKSALDEETMSLLVNKPDLSHESPVESLQSTNVHQDPQLRTNLFLSLLTCGANIGNPQRIYQ